MIQENWLQHPENRVLDFSCTCFIQMQVRDIVISEVCPQSKRIAFEKKNKYMKNRVHCTNIKNTLFWLNKTKKSENKVQFGLLNQELIFVGAVSRPGVLLTSVVLTRGPPALVTC